MGQPLASRSTERSVAEGGCSTSHGAEGNDNFSDRDLDALNEQAERCRRLAGATYNREVSEMLGDMAERYERSAAELAMKHRD
jgi:hypothetical protein